MLRLHSSAIFELLDKKRNLFGLTKSRLQTIHLETNAHVIIMKYTVFKKLNQVNYLEF